MNNLNSVLIEGVVVSSPQLSETAKGKSFCEFVIASRRCFKDAAKDGALNEAVSFIRIEAYEKLAETCCKTAKRGRYIRVVGRLKQTGWTGEGEMRYPKIVLSVEHIEVRPDVHLSEEDLSGIEKLGFEAGDGGDAVWEKSEC